MEAVLFVFFLFAFLLVASPHVVAITATGLIIASVVVRSAACHLSGVRVRLAVAFRTLVIAFLLSMLTAFGAVSALLGTPPEFSQMLASPAAHLLSLVAYVVGFRVGLGLSWQHATIVALVSSLVIGLCILLAVTVPLPLAVLH